MQHAHWSIDGCTRWWWSQADEGSEFRLEGTSVEADTQSDGKTPSLKEQRQPKED